MMDKITLWGAVLFCFLCVAAIIKDFIVLRKEAKKNLADDAGSTLREIHEGMTDKQKKTCKGIADILTANNETREEVLKDLGCIVDCEPAEIIEIEEVLGPEGSFEETCVGYGPFDLTRVYSQKAIATWGDQIWRFVGKTWRIHYINKVSFGYTQTKTIGMYPSEMYGWRLIGEIHGKESKSPE